jgi:hypothetical protein
MKKMNYIKSYKIFESNSYKYFLDREKAIDALNEGFIIVCGEKHRDFITKISDKIVDLGMVNGERWVRDIILKSSRLTDRMDLLENVLKDQLDDFITSLKEYFTDEEIKQIKHDSVHPQQYMQGLDKYQDLIVDTIKDTDITLRYPTPFNYFKDFPISSQRRFSSVTLYGESGLGLDEYNPNSLKYMKSEGELFYPIEAICRKYHYLGMLLKKQEILLEWIDKIKSTINKETNYHLLSCLVDIIYKLAMDSNADDIILSIQSSTGVTDGFKTHKQVKDFIISKNK